MQSEEVFYFSLLVTEDREYCRQILKTYTSEQLLECIRLAHSFVDKGRVLFKEIQPLIQLCAELALSNTPKGGDDYSPPFSVSQVVSLVWLLEDDKPYFIEHYSVYSPEALLDCMNAVYSLIRQGGCKLSFVQALLQTWSDLSNLASANSHQSTSASGHQFSQSLSSPLPVATTAAVRYGLLSTACSYPGLTSCTFPAFNPVKTSSTTLLPLATSQKFSSVTVSPFPPSPNTAISLPSTSQSIHSPATTSKIPVSKPKKKRRFFPTHTIIPVTQPADPVPADLVPPT